MHRSDAVKMGTVMLRSYRNAGKNLRVGDTSFAAQPMYKQVYFETKIMIFDFSSPGKCFKRHSGHSGQPPALARSLEVGQEAVGHRSERFWARTPPLSGPGQPGNDLGKFHFRSKNQHFPMDLDGFA